MEEKIKINKILIIDDDKSMTELICSFLKEKGYEVSSANNGTEGFRLCRMGKPDLIIVDILMPEIDGIKFLRLLKDDSELAKVPVIVTSVMTNIQDGEDKSFKLGVVGWISKPLDFDELHKIIKNSEGLTKNRENNKILVLEDDYVVAEAVETAINSWGYKTVVLNSGKNVIETINKEKPFMVLSDILLPEKSGFDIIRTIKNDPSMSSIPIVVMSALETVEYKKKSLLAGASEYYVSSFSSEIFLSELQTSIIEHEVAKQQKYAKILVADDDKDLAHIAIDNLKGEGFECVYAKDGEEAIEMVYKEMPDLILLDIGMPKKDGYQVFREIKADLLLSNIPIIIMTAKAKKREKVVGLELGVDDYITKPYDIDELIARAKMVLRRTSINMEANPLTKLPGNNTIEYMINENLKKDNLFAVIFVDINDFKAYNDYYGFNRGDGVIRSTARILLESLNDCKCEEDFVGHIGGDDFVILTTPIKVDEICKKIIEKFDNTAPSFYDREDRERGFITTKDRKGNEKDFSVMSLALGVVTNTYIKFTSLGQVSKSGTEMKTYAKKIKKKGSIYAVDKRKEI